MSKCFAISVRHSLVKGRLGIDMKNSSVTDTVFMNASQTAIHMSRATNITVSNTTITSSQSNGIILLLERVSNAIICNISIHSFVKDGMNIRESKNIIIVDFNVYSRKYGIFLLNSCAITITHARITGMVGIKMKNTTNSNIMNTAVMPERNRKTAILMLQTSLSTTQI